jgi:transcriptional regulator with XRE-family HTH domain
MREFARLAGANQSALSQMKLGRRPVPLARIEGWADVLGLSGRARERFLDLAEMTHIPFRMRNVVLSIEKATGKPLRDHLKDFR